MSHNKAVRDLLRELVDVLWENKKRRAEVRDLLSDLVGGVTDMAANLRELTEMMRTGGKFGSTMWTDSEPDAEVDEAEERGLLEDADKMQARLRQQLKDIGIELEENEDADMGRAGGESGNAGGDMEME